MKNANTSSPSSIFYTTTLDPPTPLRRFFFFFEKNLRPSRLPLTMDDYSKCVLIFNPLVEAIRVQYFHSTQTKYPLLHRYDQVSHVKLVSFPHSFQPITKCLFVSVSARRNVLRIYRLKPPRRYSLCIVCLTSA